MRAIVVTQPGGPEALVPTDVPEPTPQPGQVLIQVSTAGVNFADTMIRRGAYGDAVPYPVIPGNEVFGTIVAHGDGVSQPPVGTRVATMVPAGGYAELVTADAQTVLPVADSTRDSDVLAVLLHGLTAVGLLDVSAVKADDTVLVSAAAGGVGSLAVQLAVALGANVIALTSTAKIDAVRALGPAHVVDYTVEDWASRVGTLTPNGGIDVVLDSVGREVFNATLPLLSPFGRLVVFGVASGSPGVAGPEDITSLMMRNASISGFSLGTLLPSRPDLFERVPELLRRATEGGLKLLGGQSFELVDAAKAHEALEGRKTTGKVLLRVAR